MPARSGRDELAALVERFSLPPATAGPLATLLDLLAQPEAPTSVHDPGEGLRVHIADSLAGLEVEELRAAATIADLGAGAGLPGLVLAAALPRARVVLVESVGRKCEFLREAAEAMEVANVEVVCGRAEEWSDGAGRCDVVCARALAALPVLCEYAAPLLRPDGVLVAWKGAVEPAEVGGRRRGGGAPRPRRSNRSAKLRRTPAHSGARCTSLRKIAPTPAGFPRRPGMAKKRPLTAKSLR